ncbi:unnamed protein product [Acanthoscelides obtectus]|uniref:Uncharacterized protein n=1 Tax=Acanthoscelides obtectus TaxID=200917 RepID=A0A9P0LDB5_ACAOB|nr:unnamed protein product [Acanthoscelides obtectus]CAK1635961.1 hypothetical protein AOBTE_LOCUS9654 [Acanthoscelides obtectus]
MFPGKVISRGGDMDSSPQNHDLSPPDFFLWGYLKSRFYNANPKTLSELKQIIRHEMAASFRLEEYFRRSGGHLLKHKLPMSFYIINISKLF